MDDTFIAIAADARYASKAWQPEQRGAGAGREPQDAPDRYRPLRLQLAFLPTTRTAGLPTAADAILEFSRRRNRNAGEADDVQPGIGYGGKISIDGGDEARQMRVGTPTQTNGHRILPQQDFARA